MKKIKLLTVLLLAQFVIGQTKMVEYQTGHVVKLSVPDYMTRTSGLNDDACLEFQNPVKEVYTIVIEDSKENLKLSEINYEGIDEFYDVVFKDLGVGENYSNRKLGTPKKKTIGNYTILYNECSLRDKELELNLYYVMGLVETPTSFYQVMSWTLLENKEKFKKDFENIIFTLKEE
ncbi:Hypothetical protein precursor [Flavobacterium indicum GPTSA100-9 = DSM 17447]|uniref:Uncharacterized protein n=1 Tax=Flavobacterium indicum (strain DSM 17447 / CIP 109464 / GPTSA100-9) TaxID=1094466 RepID=H8XSM3_FLAIG|nr:hypothetical protein [Flavobacterium indicum]CCG52608.1 Hypothetical protein precursor [Flavobacterium indicum GPTSA100-9 = DSM 17447]